MEVRPTSQLTTSQLAIYVRPYAVHVTDVEQQLCSRDVAA